MNMVSGTSSDHTATFFCLDRVIIAVGGDILLGGLSLFL